MKRFFNRITDLAAEYRPGIALDNSSNPTSSEFIQGFRIAGLGFAVFFLKRTK